MSKLSPVLSQWLRRRTLGDGRADKRPLAQGVDSLASDWLFDASELPVLIVDAAGENIVESNSAAAAVFRQSRSALTGSKFRQAFDPASAQILKDSLDIVREAGNVGAVVRVRARSGAELTLKISSVRIFPESYLLVHPAASVPEDIAVPSRRVPSIVLNIIEDAAVGFLLTDANFRVEYANRMFLRMVNLDTQDDVEGEPLARWLRLPDGFLAKLASQLSRREAVGELTTELVTGEDCPQRVEISTVAVPDGEDTLWGFCLRGLPSLH